LSTAPDEVAHVRFYTSLDEAVKDRTSDQVIARSA